MMGLQSVHLHHLNIVTDLNSFSNEKNRSNDNNPITLAQTRSLAALMALSFARRTERSSFNDFISHNRFTSLFIATSLIKKHLCKTSHHPVHEQTLAHQIHHPRRKQQQHCDSND